MRYLRSCKTKRTFCHDLSCFSRKTDKGTLFAAWQARTINRTYMQKRQVTAKEVIEQIIEGVQEKKGKEIVVVDMLELGNSICDYFVICQGNSPAQVSAITDSIADMVREKCGKKPYAIDGLRNAQWVAMDYGDILVHIFLPDVRKFYDIEHLWADAKLTVVPDLD